MDEPTTPAALARHAQEAARKVRDDLARLPDPALAAARSAVLMAQLDALQLDIARTRAMLGQRRRR